jgi:hypothetical protein
MTPLDKTDIDVSTARRVVEDLLDLSLCSEHDFGLHGINPAVFTVLSDNGKLEPGCGD